MNYLKILQSNILEDYAEQGAYLGIPLIILIAIGFYEIRNTSEFWPTILCFVSQYSCFLLGRAVDQWLRDLCTVALDFTYPCASTATCSTWQGQPVCFFSRRDNLPTSSFAKQPLPNREGTRSALALLAVSFIVPNLDEFRFETSIRQLFSSRASSNKTLEVILLL